MLDPQFVAILRSYLRYLPEDQELASDASLRDFGLDSMASVALMLDIEDRYGIVLPDRLLTAETFASPASLWAVVDAARV